MATAVKVVPIKPQPEEKARQSDRKYGTAVMSHGSFVLPSLLLRAQARLLLTSTEMVVLLQLLEHWWTAESQAIPSMARLADRTALSRKTIQRSIDALVKKELITKVSRRLPQGGKTSNEYKFTGLIQKLADIEPDFAQARKVKRAAEKPGGLIANKS
jgi:predicted transcriptional regulator